MKPSEFVALDINEKAFVIAVIQQKVESDKKQKEMIEKGR